MTSTVQIYNRLWIAIEQMASRVTMLSYLEQNIIIHKPNIFPTPALRDIVGNWHWKVSKLIKSTSPLSQLICPIRIELLQRCIRGKIFAPRRIDQFCVVHTWYWICQNNKKHEKRKTHLESTSAQLDGVKRRSFCKTRYTVCSFRICHFLSLDQNVWFFAT